MNGWRGGGSLASGGSGVGGVFMVAVRWPMVRRGVLWCGMVVAWVGRVRRRGDEKTTTEKRVTLSECPLRAGPDHSEPTPPPTAHHSASPALKVSRSVGQRLPTAPARTDPQGDGRRVLGWECRKGKLPRRCSVSSAMHRSSAAAALLLWGRSKRTHSHDRHPISPIPQSQPHSN